MAGRLCSNIPRLAGVGGSAALKNAFQPQLIASI